jgi:hypothetical protein
MEVFREPEIYCHGVAEGLNAAEGEGEEEEIVVPSGNVVIHVVWVCFQVTTQHKKDIVNDSDCLSPSEELIMSRQ